MGDGARLALLPEKSGARVPLGDLELAGEEPCGKLPRKRLLAGRGLTGELRGERAGDAAILVNAA